MMTHQQTVQAWHAIRRQLQPGRSLTISKSSGFPHPRDAGARQTLSWPVGQLADYALDLPGAAPLLIREFVDRYDAVLLGMELAEQAASLVETNPTAALYVGGTMLGATLGALTRQRNAVLAGAAIGALTALVLHAALTQRKQSTP